MATTQAPAGVSSEEAAALLAKPLLDLVFEAAAVHREHHEPNRIQCAQLLNVKTGGCPEDCGYCSQSAHHETPTGGAYYSGTRTMNSRPTATRPTEPNRTRTNSMHART